MLITKHWKLHYLRKELLRSPSCAWMNRIPGEAIDELIGAQAALAAFLSSKQDLLTKESIGVLILGTPLDVLDQGAWWSVLSVMLGKPQTWAKITVVAMEHEKMNEEKTGLSIPSAVRTGINVIRGDLTVLQNIPPDAIDVVYFPVVDGFAMEAVFSNDDEYSLWPYLNAGKPLVIGLQDKNNATILQCFAEIYGLQFTLGSNKFNAGVYGEMGINVRYVATLSGRQPKDIERAQELSCYLSDIQDTIQELCWDVNSDTDQEDYRLWGMEVLLKSSVDASDLYITLPHNYVVRKKTGHIYLTKDSLVVSDALRGQVAQETIAQHPGPDGHWSDKTYWAAKIWEVGVGDAVKSTLGGALKSAGFDFDTSLPYLDHLMESAGITDEQAIDLKKALTGGDNYSPRQAERAILDLVKSEDQEGVIRMAEADPSLLSAKNEIQTPLLVLLGQAGMLDAMKEMLELGADVDVVDGGFRPAIVELAITGPVESVELLLEYGADPDSQDYMRWTPILCATKFSKWDTVNLLLDHGADPAIENAMGESASTLASGSSPEVGIPSAEIFSLMKKTTGVDVKKAFSNHGLISSNNDIPSSIKARLIAAD